ncbi:Mitochondrial Inner Membrane Protease Subunit 1 [Pleurotus pulmonarius]
MHPFAFATQALRRSAQVRLGRAREFWSKPCLYKAKVVGKSAFKLANMACALHIFAEYVGTVSLMSGLSMMPTLADSGEIVVEDRWSIRWNPTGIARGDLITLYSPLDPSRIICKRVIGLPGDVVCVDPTGQKAPSTEHVVIPKGHLWISGDNAAMSRDSRDYGPVSMSLVRAKLRARIYPDITIFRNPITYLD